MHECLLWAISKYILLLNCKFIHGTVQLLYSLRTKGCITFVLFLTTNTIRWFNNVSSVQIIIQNTTVSQFGMQNIDSAFTEWKIFRRLRNTFSNIFLQYFERRCFTNLKVSPVYSSLLHLCKFPINLVIPLKDCYFLTRILVLSEMLFVENKIRPMLNIFTRQDKLT